MLEYQKPLLLLAEPHPKLYLYRPRVWTAGFLGGADGFYLMDSSPDKDDRREFEECKRLAKGKRIYAQLRTSDSPFGWAFILDRTYSSELSLESAAADAVYFPDSGVPTIVSMRYQEELSALVSAAKNEATGPLTNLLVDISPIGLCGRRMACGGPLGKNGTSLAARASAYFDVSIGGGVRLTGDGRNSYSPMELFGIYFTEMAALRLQGVPANPPRAVIVGSVVTSLGEEQLEQATRQFRSEIDRAHFHYFGQCRRTTPIFYQNRSVWSDLKPFDSKSPA